MTQLMLAVTLLALSACQSAPPETAPAPIPAWSPPPKAEAWPADAHASRIVIRVGRAGPLAQLGHEHVIVGPVEGTLFRGREPATSGFRLRVAVEDLVVDPSGARIAAGLDGGLSDAARSGTRRNMLSEAVLDAGRYPEILIRSRAIRTAGESARVDAEVILRGRVHEVSVPAQIETDDAELRVDAEFTLSHAELGLEPFSTLGGSLRVADEIGITVHVTARSRAGPSR